MATIHVEKPFTLTRDTGERVSFPVGIHEVPDHVADHWYVRAHSKRTTGRDAAPVARQPTSEQPDPEAKGKGDARAERSSRGR